VSSAEQPQIPEPSAADGAPAGRAGQKPRRRGLFYTAMAIFAIGVVATIAAIVYPLLSADSEGPTWIYLVAMLCAPLGFLLAIIYAIASSRPSRH